MLDPYKISFISCVNDEELYSRCKESIETLEIPPGYSIELQKIVGAKGMASAYNQAIQKTDAKYKVYIHQDTFICNPKMLYEMLELFQSNAKIGMLGMVGGTRLPKGGVWFEDGLHSYGKVREYRRSGIKLIGGLSGRRETIQRFLPVWGKYKPMLVIDGLLMITQYDLPWREDIYDSFLYYEGPQCLEFIKAGYLVAIPGLKDKDIWCIHWGPRTERTQEDHERMWKGIRKNTEIFVREYSEFIGKNINRILAKYVYKD